MADITAVPPVYQRSLLEIARAKELGLTPAYWEASGKAMEDIFCDMKIVSITPLVGEFDGDHRSDSFTFCGLEGRCVSDLPDYLRLYSFNRIEE